MEKNKNNLSLGFLIFDMRDAVNMVKRQFEEYQSLGFRAIPGKPWNLFGFLLDFVKYVNNWLTCFLSY